MKSHPEGMASAVMCKICDSLVDAESYELHQDAHSRKLQFYNDMTFSQQKRAMDVLGSRGIKGLQSKYRISLEQANDLRDLRESLIKTNMLIDNSNGVQARYWNQNE